MDRIFHSMLMVPGLSETERQSIYSSACLERAQRLVNDIQKIEGWFANGYLRELAAYGGAAITINYVIWDGNLGNAERNGAALADIFKAAKITEYDLRKLMIRVYAAEAGACLNKARQGIHNDLFTSSNANDLRSVFRRAKQDEGISSRTLIRLAKIRHGDMRMLKVSPHFEP